MNNPRARDLFYLVAGGYLIYLAVQILREGLIGGGMEGRWRVLGLVCAIVFIGFGGGVIVRSIRHLFAERKNAQAEEMLEAAGEEEMNSAPEKGDSAPEEEEEGEEE